VTITSPIFYMRRWCVLQIAWPVFIKRLKETITRKIKIRQFFSSFFLVSCLHFELLSAMDSIDQAAFVSPWGLWLVFRWSLHNQETAHRWIKSKGWFFSLFSLNCFFHRIFFKLFFSQFSIPIFYLTPRFLNKTRWHTYS
jgi:hypothetical protein